MRWIIFSFFSVQFRKCLYFRYRSNNRWVNRSLNIISERPIQSRLDSLFHNELTKSYTLENNCYLSNLFIKYIFNKTGTNCHLEEFGALDVGVSVSCKKSDVIVELFDIVIIATLKRVTKLLNIEYFRIS